MWSTSAGSIRNRSITRRFRRASSPHRRSHRSVRPNSNFKSRVSTTRSDASLSRLLAKLPQPETETDLSNCCSGRTTGYWAPTWSERTSRNAGGTDTGPHAGYYSTIHCANHPCPPDNERRSYGSSRSCFGTRDTSVNKKQRNIISPGYLEQDSPAFHIINHPITKNGRKNKK